MTFPSSHPFLWLPLPLCPRPPLFLLQAPPPLAGSARLSGPLPRVAAPSRPLCLKFWRALSPSGEVSPLGHRSALIRFGKASSLPPPARPQPGPGAPSRSESTDPTSTFSSFQSSWGKGRLRAAKPEGGVLTFQSPPPPQRGFLITSLAWSGEEKSYFFPGIHGMCPPLSWPSGPQSRWRTSLLGFPFCALNSRKASPHQAPSLLGVILPGFRADTARAGTRGPCTLRVCVPGFPLEVKSHQLC